NVPTINESNYKTIPDSTYKEKFLSLFPEFLVNLQNQTVPTRHSLITSLNNCFTEILDRLLQSLNEQLPNNLKHIIQYQIENLKILLHYPLPIAILELPRDQYYALSTISTYMGSNNGTKYPYFFITGPAGTEKSYIIHFIINMLTRRHSNFLLLASTGVAAQSIGGKTIHSELYIIPSRENFRSHALTDNELKTRLQKIDTIIIDEISMVSAELFDFISNLFANLHNNAITFGGINIIVVSDLAQLPPITGQPIFRSSAGLYF